MSVALIRDTKPRLSVFDKTIARDNRDGHVEAEYEPGREGFEVSGIRLGLTDDDLDDDVHAQQRDGRRPEKGFKNKLSRDVASSSLVGN